MELDTSVSLQTAKLRGALFSTGKTLLVTNFFPRFHGSQRTSVASLGKVLEYFFDSW